MLNLKWKYPYELMSKTKRLISVHGENLEAQTRLLAVGTPPTQVSVSKCHSLLEEVGAP